MKKLLCAICLSLSFSVCGCASMVNAINAHDDYLNGHSVRRQHYVKSNPELPAKTVAHILSGEVIIGMTKGQVEASWGRPRNVNRSVGSWGFHEQWVYGSVYTRTYFYFENGIMTSWQD